MEKLQRQRALLQEHLRWLESEIAAETAATLSGKTKPEGAHQTSPQCAPTAASPAELAEVTAPEHEIPEPNVRGIHNEVRSGCLLYFSLACVAFGLAVAYIYWRY